MPCQTKDMIQRVKETTIRELLKSLLLLIIKELLNNYEKEESI